ncbi:hypothetical protein FC65_GL001148 [Ligilactobacillus acidipiscis DSM 15836]|uniref:ESAT-6 secretion machinery protein EssA n=2 Tax=Ligilactobacillus acidipiscis TaxID=89059 RepID=A0ABR5PHN2_9LACO|nr:hypothetical protein [Ligilactobacillus acidipiscis]KRM20094.1 hypothetical protein FC65_GL001148 [Ligilactobacillus acidipiscis DSM 15836]GAW64389.1 hypothetical protein Lacidipiscis_01583 [Ligilactobacillus acidipiscis]GEN21910.1 hypothetical protein LAC02_51910 [Ligilactobacillus acidipiscis]
MKYVENFTNGPQDYHIYSIQNDYSNHKNNHKTGLFIALSIFSISMSNNIITNQANVANFKNSLNKQEQELKNMQKRNYGFYNILEGNQESEVLTMSEVTQKDLNETERYFDNKLNELGSNIEEKIDNSSQYSNKEISDIKTKIATIQQDIANLPDNLKASKWDYFIKNIATPIVVAVITALIIGFLQIK